MRTAAIVPLACALLLSSRMSFGQDRYPVRQLTTHPAQEGFPTWSPDGKRIAYALIGRDDTAGITGLWVIPAEGGQPHQVLDVIAEHPDWSGDGASIVFDADSGNAMALVSPDGGQPIGFVPPAIPILRGGNPHWSRDGTRVVFKSARRELWVLDVRTGDARVVFSREGALPIPGGWSPDGTAIYFVLRAASSSLSSIWMVSPTGAEARAVTRESERQYRYPDVSPDGTLLAFSWCEGRNCDLWVMPSAGGAPVQLTTHPAYDDTPRWSPDGARIAFTSTRANGFDVWVMTLDIQDLRAAVAAAQRDRPGRSPGS
jgi:Tol biopolymer transport system component